MALDVEDNMVSFRIIGSPSYMSSRDKQKRQGEDERSIGGWRDLKMGILSRSPSRLSTLA